MPRIPVVQVTEAGATLVGVDASPGGDVYKNDDHTVFGIRNDAGLEPGGVRTVTFKAQKRCEDGVLHDLVVTLESHTFVLVGHLSRVKFNRGADVQVEYSDDADDLKVLAIQIQPAQR